MNFYKNRSYSDTLNRTTSNGGFFFSLADRKIILNFERKYESGRKTIESTILLCETRTYTEISYTHHHSYGQLILLLQGSLSIKTDNHELNLDEKHLFFLPPQCSHSFHSDNINKFLVLDIPRGINPAVLGAIFKYELHQVLDDRWKAIRYLLQEEARRSNKRALGDLVNYACGFLIEETRPISIQYIHNNFGKPIALQILASIENFNVSYYIEWFNKKTDSYFYDRCFNFMLWTNCQFLSRKEKERRLIVVTFDDFLKLDIRVGEIVQVEVFKKAKKPAYKLWVDFGNEIGIKKSSAQITECYRMEELVGKQVLGVVNFPPRQIADFMSEVLVLGIYAEQGVVLIQPEQPVKKGDKLG